MRRMQRIVLLVTFAAVMPVLAGCADFDPDKLDVFGLNEKKKLAGDRKAVFPEGVPGVSQGIPPQYRVGANPPPDAAPVVPVEPAPAAAPPAKKSAKKTASFTQDAKPRVKRAPKPATVQQQQAPAGEQAPWPDQAPPQQSSSGSPWPAPPPAGTFSR